MITVETRLVSQIIHQIDELIRDTHTSREKKVEDLKNLAMTCWQKIIPEYENPESFNKLETDEVQRRWASVHSEVENMRQNPKFCMFLIGRLPAVISIG